jgi:hypothetical protein
MTTILTKSEATRKAVKWISEQLTLLPDANINQLIDRAALTFDLTPKQTEQLEQFYSKK